MKVRLKLLSIFILIFIFLLGACDSNNNSNAQDGGDEPTAMGDECPCFAPEDLEILAMKSTNIQCSIEGVSLLLTFNTEDMAEIAAACLLDGGCSCQSPYIFMGGAMPITEEEYSLCLQNMLNAMIMFNIKEDKLESCVITSN